MKLRTKFVISIAVSVFVPVLVISLFSYYSLRRDIINFEGHRLKSISSNALYKVDQMLDSKKNELAVFSSIDTIKSSLEYDIYDQAFDLLSGFVANFPGYQKIDLINKSGMVVSSSDQGRIKTMAGFLSIAKNQAVISKPDFSPSGSKYFINIAVPVYQENSQAGLVVASYDMKNIFEEIDLVEVAKEKNDAATGHIMIVTEDGMPIYAPRDKRDSAGNILTESFTEKTMVSMKSAISKQTGFVIEEYASGEKVLSGYDFLDGNLKMAAISLNKMDAVLSEITVLLQRITMIAIAFIVISIIAAIMIAERFIRPLTRVVSSLQDIAEGGGDLTVRLNLNSSDEIGELSKAFNVFCDKIHDMVVRIAKTSKSIKDSSSSLISIAESVSVDAKAQASKISETSIAVHQIASSVDDVAKNATTSADAAREVSSKVDDGNHTIEMTASGMTNIAGRVKDSFKEVESLGNKVEEIGGIVSIINEVADQTNLLALNAAIEAARAGEQGRGFAVVADEVRKLAERTSSSTQEIIRVIRDIQTETSKSVSGMKEVVKEVDEGMHLVEKAKDALNAISKTAEKGAEMAEMIASSAEEQSHSTGQISESMQEVSAISKETDTSSDQMKDASIKLLNLAKELDHMLSVFKTSDSMYSKTDNLTHAGGPNIKPLAGKSVMLGS
jgi:methyl-accepting chemotaxis protein